MLKNKITIISSDNLLFTNAILLFLNTIIHSLELYNVFPYLLLSMLLMCVLEIIFLFKYSELKRENNGDDLNWLPLLLKSKLVIR